MSLRKKALMILLSVAVIVAMTPMMALSAYADSVNVTTAGDLQTAVNTYETVVLDADITGDITIPYGKTVTLDLNKHTLTGKNNNTTSKVNGTNVKSAITNHGKLTITGSGTVQAGEKLGAALYNANDGTTILNGGTYKDYAGAATNHDGWYIIQNFGNMTINQNTIVTNQSPENASDTAIINGCDNQEFGSNPAVAAENISKNNLFTKDATMIINGGSFTGGIFVIKNGDWYANMIINGGIFTSKKSSNKGVVLSEANNCPMTVTGGTFTVEGADSDTPVVKAKNKSIHYCNSKATGISITGGVFKNEGKGDSIQTLVDGNVAEDPIMSISGGTFTGTINKNTQTGAYNENPNNIGYKTNELSITGGTFSSDPSSYVPSGYVVSGSSPWTVSQYVAPAPAPTTNTTTTTGTDGTTEVNTTTNADVSVKDGTATVTIPESDLNKVVTDTAAAEKTATDAGKKVDSNIVIDGNTSAAANATKADVEIPATTASKIATDTNATVTVETPIANLTLDQKTLDKIADTSKGAGTVKVEVNKVDEKTLTADQQKSIGDNAVVVSLSIVTDNGKVTDFNGGTVTVTMPAPANATAENTVLVNVKDDGTLEIVPCKIVDGKIVATLSHFSYYAIADKTTVEKTIAAQNAAAQKAADEKTTKEVKATKITKLSAKVTKGKVKLTWSNKGVALEGYKIYKSTKSTSGYKCIKTSKSKTYTLSKGLKKGKTYYFKVRGYKTVDKTKVYTSYAKIKVVAK